MNQCRLEDRLPDERKYVIYNYKIDSMIKAPFGVITTLPDDPNPLFDDTSSTISSSISTSTTKDTHIDNSRDLPNRKQTVNATTQTETEEWTDNSHSSSRAALWHNEFVVPSSY